MVSSLSSLSCKFELGVRELDSSRRMMMKCWSKPSDFHQGELLRLSTKYELPSGFLRFPSKFCEIASMPAFKPQLFACGAEVVRSLYPRSGQKDVLVISTLMSYNRSPQYCKRVSGCLRNRESWGKNMFYKCFWNDMQGSVWKTGHQLEPCMKNFSSSSTPCSTGAVPKASYDGVSQEEQIEESGASSAQKSSGVRSLKLLSGSCYLPHPAKEETGGEDAHFISTEQAIGVADGVGGWADLGVNAGHYARELMSHSVSAIGEEPKGSIDPARVLEKAYLNTKARGSSTACIVALTNQGVHAVNLGDSGFIIVRDGCAVFRSPVQQHDFNFTYQLESGNSSDLPSSGQVFTFPVIAGDVIVAGTDGLFDNLYNNEVTAIVVHCIRAGLSPKDTAQKIAALARKCALDRNRQSPFAAAAKDAGFRYYGGKLDDITVVISYVTSGEHLN
ncbi:probable protein phosphatase 2C 55 [Phalaenopsis equestris]|uniref:probable protein phosphatase 2C 55 n=1 Tax=Phalaenopsis equestris TaxID=78828 RepID=UPI0009E29967|nr:probable protein phosphatase 2C 55 [Phalaenopsis equestris]XP_020580206.1 probable protein phosphatase 2C 55 [Phalaenopsis equestris]XP_020580208.1 probable protein phosphatase 2C 55 [Phalaenopsis equestris]